MSKRNRSNESGELKYILTHLDQDMGAGDIIKAGTILAVAVAGGSANAFFCRPGAEEVTKERFEAFKKTLEKEVVNAEIKESPQGGETIGQKGTEEKGPQDVAACIS